MKVVVKKRGLIFAISFVCFLFVSKVAYGATFYFDPQESVVGIDNPFTIALNLDATKSINTISTSVLIPKGLVPVSINDGNSIINTWIEAPRFNESKGTISFSGIIPGGFVGKGGRLISFKLHAVRPGNVVINLLKNETVVLLNGPDGKYDEVSILPQNLTISSLKNNLDVSLPDITPPESFSPTLFRDNALHNNKWVVLFNTQDKGSGMNHYEVQETRADSPVAGLWKVSDSPYVLEDQLLSSNIFVKAVDESGNERIEEIRTTNPISWYQLVTNWIILGVIISLGLLTVLYAKKYYFKKK